ncbi:hypothetical protein L5515_002048 [Caenorhabditis briggsae]|uniref:Uncharacterized protein n=1 Tax=Caenorhabditis briggsae TaxID=6238 RepID=A0AAE9E4F2_CAEBR|nr:hypothetical protein L5515_002048 [Caenorhabditis briggsae]
MDCEEIDSEKKSGSGSDYDDDDAMNGDEDNEVDEARQTFAFVNVETRFRNRTAENVLAELLAQCKRQLSNSFQAVSSTDEMHEENYLQELINTSRELNMNLIARLRPFVFPAIAKRLEAIP